LNQQYIIMCKIQSPKRLSIRTRYVFFSASVCC